MKPACTEVCQVLEQRGKFLLVWSDAFPKVSREMCISHLIWHLMGTVAVVINALLFIKNSFLPKLEIFISILRLQGTLFSEVLSMNRLEEAEEINF